MMISNADMESNKDDTGSGLIFSYVLVISVRYRLNFLAYFSGHC